MTQFAFLSTCRSRRHLLLGHLCSCLPCRVHLITFSWARRIHQPAARVRSSPERSCLGTRCTCSIVTRCMYSLVLVSLSVGARSPKISLLALRQLGFQQCVMDGVRRLLSFLTDVLVSSASVYTVLVNVHTTRLAFERARSLLARVPESGFSVTGRRLDHHC